MKQIKLLILLLLIGQSQFSFARLGYHINLKIAGVTDSKVYLVHYYGKPGPTVYISDSANFDKDGNAEFNGSDIDFVGGIYIMLLAGQRTSFEFMLNKGDDISINATMSKLPDGITFKNSPENDRFEEYLKYLKAYNKKEEGYKKDLEAAQSSHDTEEVRKRATVSLKELNNYRKDYVKKYPGTLLANIFRAMETPEIPEGDHFLEDGHTKDSTFGIRYYQKHYWDGFNFKDDRLIYTPLYDGKLEDFFAKWVQPVIDSQEFACDEMMSKVKGTKDLFHYTLWWLTNHFESSKIMGMDEVFVYLVEKYYMTGEATWLKQDELDKYIDRARKIAPNVPGNKAPEVKLPNVKTGKMESMLAMKAKYTLLVFYSPSCGHCQHEIPKIDSVYNELLKAKGVKVFTVATDGEEKDINDFITKNHMEEWTNCWDHEHIGDFHNKYDVYSTPVIYLIDDKKIIRGKRMDHGNVGRMLKILEDKEKEKNKSKQ